MPVKRISQWVWMAPVYSIFFLFHLYIPQKWYRIVFFLWQLEKLATYIRKHLALIVKIKKRTISIKQWSMIYFSCYDCRYSFPYINVFSIFSGNDGCLSKVCNEIPNECSDSKSAIYQHCSVVNLDGNGVFVSFLHGKISWKIWSVAELMRFFLPCEFKHSVSNLCDKVFMCTVFVYCRK